MSDAIKNTKACPIDFAFVNVDPRNNTLIAAFEAQPPVGPTEMYLTPLYIFLPLLDAVEKRYMVEVAPAWPMYAQPVVMKFAPVPYGIPTSGIDKNDIGINERPQDKERGWDQMKYKGWPLYYLITSVDPDHSDFNPPIPEDFDATNTYPTMFVPAKTGISFIPTDSDSDVTVPGPYLGP